MLHNKTTFNKIFGIGLNKTGTTSLHQAFGTLNIRSFHYSAKLKEIIRYEKASGMPILSSLSNYKAFLDHPIETHFIELDQQYPGSKFILTIRDLHSWLESRKKHVTRNQQDPNYKGNWLEIDINAWVRQWKKHHKAVREYFVNRKNDLIVMNIIEGDGWEKLCPFLGLTVPRKKFPHINSADQQKWAKKWNKLITTILRRPMILQ